MKNIYHLLILVLGSLLLTSNSAQPGVWNAGGSGTFTLLYPEDTIAYKKIQMKSEDIFMQIYKGFAAVKGNYYFKNTSKDTLKIKVGYPVNNVFKNISHNQYTNNVSVDGLYKVKGLVNSTETPIYKKPNSEKENWYVWEISFPPNKITKFTVYFLVNTNNAKVLQGYNSEKKNAFIYLIETGSLWKSPIEKGLFYTQFKDNISIKDVKGSSPTKLYFNKENNILKFSLLNYGKSPDKNFVITYGETIEEFNFKSISKNSSLYFSEIDSFSTRVFKNLTFSKINLSNPYKVDGVSNYLISAIFYFTIYGIPLLIVITGIILIRIIYRKFFKKK